MFLQGVISRAFTFFHPPFIHCLHRAQRLNSNRFSPPSCFDKPFSEKLIKQRSEHRQTQKARSFEGESGRMTTSYY